MLNTIERAITCTVLALFTTSLCHAYVLKFKDSKFAAQTAISLTLAAKFFP